jgi:PAS domain S-box-containing protein
MRLWSFSMIDELADRISNLQTGAHFCLFYDRDPVEQMPALVPYIRAGLSKNEQCIYVADDQTVEELSGRLEESGIDTTLEIQRGALKLWSRREWRQPGELSSADKLAQLAEFIQRAFASGFAGIRFAIEMTWALGPDISAERMEHWEASLNTIFTPDFPGQIVCQYNRHRIAPQVVLAALYTHPLLIVGDEVYSNVFYQAPLILDHESANGVAAKVEWMISQLKHARTAEKERQILIQHQAARAEAEQSQKQLDNILSLLPAAVYTCDSDGRITFFNKRAAQLWGRTPKLNADAEKYCGSVRLVSPDGTAVPPNAALMAKALETGESLHDAEAAIERPDGSRIPISVNIDPLYNPMGRRIGAINVFQDITHLKTAEESRRRLAAIVEFSDDAIISKDLNGTIMSWNRGAEKLFGYAAEEIIGQSVLRLIPPDRYNEEPGILERIRRGEPINHYETVRQRKDGSLVEISLSVSPIKDLGGEVIGASKIARDITGHKEAERALRAVKDELTRANEELEIRVRERTAALELAQAARLRDMEEQKKLEEQLRQAQKMEGIGTLAGGIAHDFNNILNIIKGYTSILPRDDQTNADALKVIEDTIERGASLVKQLLTLARKSETRLTSTDPNKVLSELSTLLQQTLPKTVDVSLQLESSLPPIMADPSQMTQALLNLCVNARDAMPAGGKLVLTSAAVGPRQVQEKFPQAQNVDYVRIEVTDSGTGMEPGMRTRIFEPFYTTKAQGQGTGLGLAIVYGIIKNHHGFIDVTSALGAGTTFSLYLPITEREGKPASTNLPARHLSAVKSAYSRGAILIAEDEQNMLSLLRRSLSRIGYQVFTAGDGQEVIDLYHKHKEQIQVVLLDIGLPKIQGWDVIVQLRRDNPQLSIVVTSGYIDPDLKIKMDRASIDAVVYKPYAIGQIIETLQNVIERSRRPCPRRVKPLP